MFDCIYTRTIPYCRQVIYIVFPFIAGTNDTDYSTIAVQKYFRSPTYTKDKKENKEQFKYMQNWTKCVLYIRYCMSGTNDAEYKTTVRQIRLFKSLKPNINEFYKAYTKIETV